MTEGEAKVATWVVLAMLCMSDHWLVSLVFIGLFLAAAKKGYGGL